jgi:hypothetical protein
MPEQCRRVRPVDLYDKIDAVHERSTDASAIARDVAGTAVTGARRVAEVAAWAGIRGPDKREARGEADATVGAHKNDPTVLHRLTKTLQRRWPELGHLVEEEHSEVRQRRFPRPWRAPATHEPGDGCRVMRRAERSPTGERERRIESCDRVDESALEGLGAFKRRQDGRQSSSQHGLPRTRRADEYDVVATGRSDHERSNRQVLTCDLAEIDIEGCGSGSSAECDRVRQAGSKQAEGTKR